MKKQFLILFAFISVLALSQVPQRFNKVIVTGDITSPKFIKTGSNSDSVLLGNGSARSVNSLKTDTINLSNRINAKAAGNGTANGTNTGDETLTSIKTKLGAATSGSDGYLKYQDWSIFNSKEPAITKNSGFNKNFGTTTGTVLEGRTFGTAAGSAVGDFVQINPSSAQSGGIWINGQLILDRPNGGVYINKTNGVNTSIRATTFDLVGSGASTDLADYIYGNNSYSLYTNGIKRFSVAGSGAATFASTVNSTGFLLNGNNLTSSLSTNYIPKWNGSSFVNATAGTDYQLPITLTTNGTSGAATFSGNVLNVPNYTSSGSFIQNQSASAQSGSLWVSGNIISNDKIEGITISTESVDINTSGAQINFYGTSGSGVLSQPFRGLNYKKVMIYLANFVGNNNINYLTAFTYPPVIVITDGLSSSLITSKSTTSVTITSASSATGILILEGY